MSPLNGVDLTGRFVAGNARLARAILFSFLALCGLFWLAGCAVPISARRVPTERAYTEAMTSALSGNQLSDHTQIVLRRYDLDREFKDRPSSALQQLHQRATTDDRRDILFALAELSYVRGRQTEHPIKAWAPRIARDYYLASAIYAYLYLFGSGKEAAPTPFDPRIRLAGDLYDRALAKGLAPEGSTNGTVVLESGTRQPFPGPVALTLIETNLPVALADCDQMLPAEDFIVHGLTVRNRQFGLGAPLIIVQKRTKEYPLARRSAATVLLRVSGGIRDWTDGKMTCALELHSAFAERWVEIAGQRVPMEVDTTAPMAHALNDSFIWRLGSQQFFSSDQLLKSGVYPTQPYEPGLIPVVFVHGTLSSPVWWAEMANTLRADPVLGGHFQLWAYVYNTGNTLSYSAANFRDALTNLVHRLDPEGRDPALRQVVLIGHSQGGLLSKMAVTDPGDKLWRAISDHDLESTKLSEPQRAEIRRSLFFKPLPFVTRVVFISTPHHGSYMATSWVRRIAAKFIALPGELVEFTKDAVTAGLELRLPIDFRHRMPTSLDSMSPSNPVLLTLADIPPAPGVVSHSIISVKGSGDPKNGNDGVVSYQSAHLPYVESELVVRSGHSCQGKPATIEEVRRILLEHMARLPEPINPPK